MNVFLLRALILTSLSTVVLLFPALSAQAQQSEGLQIRPAIIEDRVDPGDVYNFSIKLTNISDLERTIYLDTQNITGLDARGVPIFAEGNEPTPHELRSWVTLPKDVYVLLPQQTVDVPFTIRVPNDASPGAHFGGIFFDSRPPQAQTTGAAVGARVGTIINLRIAGTIVEEMLLREFSTEKFIYSSPPVNFLARIDNLGNVLLRPRGGIEVTDMFGKKVATVTVNESGAAVFPASDRTYEAVWEHEGVAFGRYQAQLGIIYGEEGRKTVVRSTSFWILPLKPVLTLVATLLGSVLLLFWLVRRHIKKTLRTMGVSARAEADVYARRYNRPISRLTFVAVGIALLGIALLIILFALFA